MLSSKVSDVKSYAQNCPVALALDAIGDRWTLLILRELALGDQRFTDLRNALPGIAPNLLSSRLAELVDRGLVARAELPPPAARSVYRLSGRGEGVRPVLGALARFGVPDLPREPSEPMRPLRALLTLLSAYYRGPQEGLDRVQVTVDGTPFLLALGDRVEVLTSPEGARSTHENVETGVTGWPSGRRATRSAGTRRRARPTARSSRCGPPTSRSRAPTSRRRRTMPASSSRARSRGSGRPTSPAR